MFVRQCSFTETPPNMEVRRKMLLPLIFAFLLVSGTSAEQPNFSEIAETLFTLVPTSTIKDVSLQIKQKIEHFMKDLMKPASMKLFVKLLKESKIHNKGEIIRLSMTLPTAYLHPERTVDSFKRIDKKANEEMAVVFTKFLEQMIPASFGEKYKHFNKYVNEEDIRTFSALLFEVLEKTPTHDIVWSIETLYKESKEAQKSVEKILEGDPELLLKAVKETSNNEVKEKVKEEVENFQKFTQFEKFSSYLPQFIEAIKKAINHFLDQLWDDIEDKVGNVDPKAVVDAINIGVEKVTAFTSKASAVVDTEDLSEDVGSFLTRLQGLSPKELLEEAKTLKTYLPPTEDILEDIDKINKTLITAAEKEQIKKIVQYLIESQLPTSVEEMLAEVASTQLKKVNVKQVQGVIEFLSKDSKANSELYDGIKSTIINIVKNKFQSLTATNRTNASFRDIIINLEKEISKIDDSKVADLLKKVVKDVNSMSPKLIAEVASDFDTILKDVLNHHELIQFLYDPVAFLQNLNRSIIHNLVSLNVDSIKLLDEHVAYDNCMKSAALNKEDLKKEFAKLFNKIEGEIKAVPNGENTLKKIKFDEIKYFLVEFLPRLNIKNICIDIKGTIKLCKILEPLEKDELTDLIWNFRKTHLTQDKTEENKRDVIDLLDALHYVILKRNGNNSSDFRLKAVDQAKEYFQKQFSTSKSGEL